MYFRFGSALVLIVLISLGGIALEKRNLQMRRDISRQHFQMDVLRDAHARLRLKNQQLAGPVRVLDALEKGTLAVEIPAVPTPAASRRVPLLRWRQADRFFDRDTGR